MYIKNGIESRQSMACVITCIVHTVKNEGVNIKEANNKYGGQVMRTTSYVKKIYIHPLMGNIIPMKNFKSKIDMVKLA